MVHLSVVPASPRERARRKRRQQFLAVAAAIVAEEGIDGLTMALLADRADCAIGTAYGYFPSKAALVGALRREAIDTLRRSLLSARPEWDSYLDREAVGDPESAVVRLLGYGGFLVAASVAFPEEVRLLGQVLGDAAGGTPEDEWPETVEVLRSLLAEPAGLLESAAEVRVVDAGEGEGRALRWTVAVLAQLPLDALASVQPSLFRAHGLARELTGDLLVGWGVGRELLARAQRHLDRLSAVVPLAPAVPPVDP